MHIFERIVKIVITFFIFIFAQALIAASINTLFDLMPVRIDRFFTNSFSDKLGSNSSISESKKNLVSAIAANTDDRKIDGKNGGKTNDVITKKARDSKEKSDNSLTATRNIVQSFVDTAPLVT